jgi:hypothetical protein
MPNSNPTSLLLAQAFTSGPQQVAGTAILGLLGSLCPIHEDRFA